MANLLEHNFSSCNELANSLASEIGEKLKEAIKKDGKASIALSGGSTPKKMLNQLSKLKNINWEKVDVTLVDERFVDENSSRSNAKMLKENLLINEAKSANFFPLFLGSNSLNEQAIEQMSHQQKYIKKPFDIVVLGMGLDGHTASFFPNVKNLHQALNSTKLAMAINASDGEERITLTFPYLISAKNIYLHIEGEEKQQVLEKALNGMVINDMPIRAFLLQDKAPINIYKC
ncbi:MAG: 6-phosphogluconolactonase [Devosiaceae bacterium]|nr:6-phosphogluconolactonase [Devosiaceae bacterium]